jgi:hypothetical protein
MAFFEKIIILFGKDTENDTKKPSAKPRNWVPRVWVLTQVKRNHL